MSGQKAPLAEALEVLLRFGTLMLRAGDTAFRVRDSMGMLATSRGIESLSLHITINGMTATARRNGEQVTVASEVSPPGINAWRIGALERLARTRPPRPPQPARAPAPPRPRAEGPGSRPRRHRSRPADPFDHHGRRRDWPRLGRLFLPEWRRHAGNRRRHCRRRPGPGRAHADVPSPPQPVCRDDAVRDPRLGLLLPDRGRHLAPGISAFRRG